MIIDELERAFLAQADMSRGLAMSAYMKNHFVFYGLPAPVRKDIQKAVFSISKPNDYPTLITHIRAMWQKPEREWHYAAIDLLASCKKLWQSDMIETIESMLIQNAWWDSVDGLSSQVVAPYFKKFPQVKSSCIDKWKISDNMWLRRVSIIHQLKAKKDTDLDLLTECILLNSESKEFFLQKAIGWALREYAKINPEWVIRFVDVNDLKPLSKREALKNIQA